MASAEQEIRDLLHLLCGRDKEQLITFAVKDGHEDARRRKFRMLGYALHGLPGDPRGLGDYHGVDVRLAAADPLSERAPKKDAPGKAVKA